MTAAHNKCEKYNPWSDEELRLAYLNINVISDSELEDLMQRNIDNIRGTLRRKWNKGHIPKVRKLYSNIEDDFLLDNYGLMPTEDICTRLYRSKNSVSNRVRILFGYTDVTSVGGKYCIRDIAEIMGVDRSHISRIAKKEPKVFNIINNTYLIDQDAFWKWIKNYLPIVKAENIIYENLYHCPEWYKEYINEQKRIIQNQPKRTKPTSKEIALIKHLRSKGYSLSEIGKEVNRTKSSVRWVLDKEALKRIS